MKILKKAEDFYAARRHYKRKQYSEPEDEYSRVRLTLLEYGVKTNSKSIAKRNQQSIDVNDEMEEEEVSFLSFSVECF